MHGFPPSSIQHILTQTGLPKHVELFTIPRSCICSLNLIMNSISPYLLSATIVVSSIVVYQVCMKLVPEGINPVSALLTFYVSALICTLLTAAVLGLHEGMLSINQFTWPAVLVGVAIVAWCRRRAHCRA